MPFFQAKLTVNTPGDPYEQEADRVADQVMHIPDPVQRGEKTEKNGAAPVEIQRKVAPVPPVPAEVKQPAATPALSRVQPSLVQAKCAECSQKEKERKEEEHQEGKIPVMRATKIHDINGAGVVPVQRACANCAKEEEVRRKEKPEAINGAAPVQIQRASADTDQEEEMTAMRKESSADAGGKAAPSIVSDVLSSGSGRPMDAGTRDFMESRFGQDFGQVRIHTDAQAAESASAINARAYTSGSNVVFGNGEYRPETDSGRRLLAHELVHVGQQGGASQVLRQDSFELEADTESFDLIGEYENSKYLVGKRIGQLARIGAHQYQPDKDNYETIVKDGKKVYKTPNAQDDNVVFKIKYNEIVEAVGLYAKDAGWALIAGPTGSGWIQTIYLHYPLPDISSKLYFVQNGDMLKDVIAKEYGGQQGVNVREWGADVRLFVHAIVLINEAAGKQGIGQNKEKQDIGLFKSILLDKTGEESQKIWNSAYLKYGYNIWLPSKSLIDELKSSGLASAGSITYSIVEALKDIFLFGGGLIVGVFEGLWEAFVDTLTGIVDLFELIGTFIKKLFNGELLDWLKEMYEGMKEAISNLDQTAKDIWAEFMKKSAYEKGRAVGKIIGYILFEILLILFTAGVVTAIKWAGKAGKLAKAFKGVSKIVTKAKKVEKIVPDPSPSVKDKLSKATKAKKKWKIHEKDVNDRLAKKYGKGKVAEQVTLDVTGPGGDVVRIRIDNLVDTGGGKYKLVDAKHSEVSDLTKGDLHSTLTENQKQAFKWIKEGKTKNIEVRGEKGEQIGLSSGDYIKVDPSIEIHVNSPSGISERIY